MKNYLIIVALLLTSVMSVQAGHVGEFEASQKALSFMKKNAGTRSAEPNLTRVYLPLETKAAAWSVVDAPLYAFNCEGGGYVIVSGDDRTAEILAFSEKGRINQNRLPVNMKSWLQGYVSKIEQLSAGSVLRQAGTRADGAKSKIEPKLETAWGQDYPYNLHSPELHVVWEDKDATVHAATGCVATAMAQLLNYYRYPDATLVDCDGFEGTADVPVSIESQGQVKVDTVKVDWKAEAVPAGSKIDWANIVDQYDTWNYETKKPYNKYNNTEAQREAVSRLIQYCGVASGMQYGMESTARTDSLVFAFYNVMGYKDVYLQSQVEYESQQEWIDAVYEEMAVGGPVLFAGQTPTQGGHQFILDGYQYKNNNHYFYANWGWDGENDGYVLLDVMSPGWIFDDDGNEEGFADFQSMICGLGPNGNGMTTCQAPALYMDEFVIGEEGKNYKRLSKNDSFLVSDYYLVFSNIHTPSCTTVPALCVLDKGGDIVSAIVFADIKTGIEVKLGYSLRLDSKVVKQDLEIGGKIDDGTYKVVGLLIDVNAKDWTKDWTLMQKAESLAATMTVKGNTATFKNAIPTAIEPVAAKVSRDVDTPWYSLSGARISGTPSAKGIYVKDGKKILVK